MSVTDPLFGSVGEILLEYAPQTPRMIVGFSGGPDSVYLAESCLKYISREKLLLAHFDHRVRENSSADESWCRQWAQDQKVAYASAVADSPLRSEDQMRQARHAFLQHLKEREGEDAIILLGTHKDDHLETVLHQFCRGSGIRGLRGPLLWTEQTRLLRPLIDLQKAEILQELEMSRSQYLTDITNQDQSYTRNFLRHSVIPLLEDRYPQLSDRVLQRGYLMSHADDFLSREVDASLRKIALPESQFDREGYAQLHTFLQLGVIRKMMPFHLSLPQTQTLRDFVLRGASGKQAQIQQRAIQLSQKTFRLIQLRPKTEQK